VPREERIEAILAAWYDLITCAPSEKAARRNSLNALLDEVIVGTRSCRQELHEALGPRFQDYKIARRKEHQARMARILRQS
jgi:hypothetical protein